MNLENIHRILSDIEQQARLAHHGLPDNHPVVNVYMPSILENVRVGRLILNEKPAPSLLSHLCSLTVAERETILRISDLVAQTWCYDEYASDKDRVFNAIQLVRDVEAELRTPI